MNNINMYANPATAHASHEDQAAAYQAWVVACAKVGHSDAANVRASAAQNVGEFKERRNTIRRAINAITANIGNNSKEFTPEITAALSHGGQLIARIESGLEHLEKMSNETRNAGMKALRNSADFAKHYGTDGSSDGDGMNIADFLRGAAKMKTSTAVQNALSVGTDAAGGFTVPSVLMPGILSALVPVSSLMRAGASIVPLDSGGKSFTTAAMATIPTASWRAEAGALATSDPAFRSVVAAPKSLAFQFKISRELLADGQNITDALYLAIAQSFAKELDRAGLRGSGTAPEPRGLLNVAGVQAVGNGTNGASLATLKYANLFSAVQALLQADAPMPTAAIMSPRSLVGLGQLADSTAQPLRVPGMLEPMQLIGTSQIPNTLTVGSSTDCTEMYVGDFGNLYFMMRENVSIQVLNELYAGTGEIGFACHVRADVMCTYPAAFAVVTGIRP